MFEIKNNIFYFNNKPEFILADTCWSAFTNATIDDWKFYIDYRAKQGFNVIQVNLLRQWDASSSNLELEPFEIGENGKFNFNKRNDLYFNRAYEMMKYAKDKGITIALVLLWANYLPDTWATKLRETNRFPKENIDEYIDFVVEKYDELNPIYIISGDTDFPTDEVILEYYNKALNRVKEKSHSAITTLHIRGREDYIPEVLINNNNLGFYMYQSGHNIDFQNMGYVLAEKFSYFSPKRPVINSEPCYEMMGYSRKVYGRFSREDVRRIAWQSVFAGANAGLTYGAHGIWSWHNEQNDFDSDIGEAFETPYDWRDALKFNGAWDYAFLRQFVLEEQMYNGQANQDILLNETDEIRVMEANNNIFIYVPSNIKLKIKGDLSGKNIYYIDLESKNRCKIQSSFNAEHNYTIINMHRFNRDAVLVIK